MDEVTECFRCGKPIEEGRGVEVYGGAVGEDLELVPVHRVCNRSFGGRMTYFFGPGHEDRRAMGAVPGRFKGSSRRG